LSSTLLRSIDLKQWIENVERAVEYALERSWDTSFDEHVQTLIE